MLKKIYINIILLCCALLFCKHASAQDANKQSPKFYYEINDYDRALEAYLAIWHDHQTDMQVNFRIANCLLHVNGDRSKALPYLNYIYKHGNTDPEVICMLGQAYMYAYSFDEALKYFSLFKAKTIPKNIGMAELYIAYCNNAAEMVKHPLNVIFENLGKDINTRYPDYYPFVAEGDSTLYYTARRETNTGNITSWQGFYTSDIYVSRIVNGVFGKSKNLGTFVNTPEDEQCVYVSPNGKNMIVYVDNAKLKISEDLFMTNTDKGKAFPKPAPFEDPVNTDFAELEGCITANLGTMIISSDRPGGLGETDLYMVERNGGEKWSKPVNLGPNVNTKYNEAFPVFDESTHTLYFASDGLKSMGGYDIFKSLYDPKTKTFGPAVNVGYPVNTPEDNMVFSPAANKLDGYISAYRPEGLGNLDIYKVIFKTLLSGTVGPEDTTANVEGTITLMSRSGIPMEVKELTGKNPSYSFLLSPGRYLLKAKISGFPERIEEVIIDGQNKYVSEKKNTIIFRRPSEIAPPANPKGTKSKTPVHKK